MIENHEILPFQRLVLSAAGQNAPRCTQVFALDNACAHIARMTQEPLMAQVRLAWWRDGIVAEQALAEHRSGEMDALRGVDRFADMRAGLVDMINGWEELLVADGEEWSTMLPVYAHGRGHGVFAALCPDHAEKADHVGQVWALWDLAGHVADEALTQQVLDAARLIAGDGLQDELRRLPRMLRMMAIPAISDVLKGKAAPLGLTGRLYRHMLRIQLFGR